jgi:hypothetical protein
VDDEGIQIADGDSEDGSFGSGNQIYNRNHQSGTKLNLSTAETF